MKNVYVAYRWRYALFMYPFVLISLLLARYLSHLFYQPEPLDAVDTVFFFAGSLAIMLVAMSVTPIEQSNIEVSGDGIIGPMSEGLFNTKRKRISPEDIDLEKSKCRFFRAYLHTHDGKKMLVSSPALGMDQVRSLFAKVRKMKG